MASKESRRVDKLVAKYKKRLGLEAWRLAVSIVEEDDMKIAPDGAILSEEGHSAGHTRPSPSYKGATLTFCRKCVQACCDEELDNGVRHEMLHLVTSPLWQFVMDMFETMPTANLRRLKKSFAQVNEGVTSDLTRIIGP